MPTDFRARAAALEVQLEQVRHDLKGAKPSEKLRLQALEASLKRSLRWYQARAGTRSDVHALSVSVADEITASEHS